ncbi:LppU/SCO3897 family protein [Micromonospora sp. SH-82]|uniref:LppU/SCO3897 family protein n=1 Tax=Micromonospora sp. SH-82 TaxID=3132938 RepID=UPI003EBEBDED
MLPFPLEGPGVDPEPPPRRQWRIRLLAIAVAFTVVALAGGGAVLLLKRSAEEPVADATPPPAAGADLPEPGTPSPGAAPESSADPRFAEVGQCVRNDGMVDGQPKLLITECAPKTYEVLRRFDEATSGGRDAEAKCAGVEGYTNWYFYDSDLDTLDFVLCLKLR